MRRLPAIAALPLGTTRRSRLGVVRGAMLGLAAQTLLAVAADADVQTAADVCAPNADPCLISSVIRIDTANDIDFGLRQVKVVAGGRIEFGRARIVCGSFIVDGPVARIGAQVDTEDHPSFSVRARGACSGDGATPCLDSSSCQSSGLGTCNFEAAVITFNAQLHGNHPRGTSVELVAAGAVTIAAGFVVNGTGIEGDAGDVTLRSYMADVVVDGPINARPAPPQGDSGYGRPYSPGYAGYLTVEARRDALLRRPIDLSLGYIGGDVEIRAGRDIIIAHNILRDGVDGYSANGGGGEGRFTAGRDMVVKPHGPTDDITFLSANGGNYRYVYNDGYYSYDYGYGASAGGDTYIDTGRNFVMEQKTQMQADSPEDNCNDGSPYGGRVHIESGGGFSINGHISGRAAGLCGNAGRMYLYAERDGEVGPTGNIDFSAVDGGRIYISTPGNLVLDGGLDVRGDPYSYPDYDGETVGTGGAMELRGDDLHINGQLWLGGPDGGQELYGYGCRVRVGSTARIRNIGGEYSYGIRNHLQADESMIVEQGARILAQPDGYNHIHIRAADRPPLLFGYFDPPPEIEDGYYGDECTPCGDGRIENDETCDDGNITDDDGCNHECVNEGCIAESIDYPAEPLCSDGSDCTSDRCDPVSSTCVHEPGCADEVACTLEQCQGETCSVTPMDAACEDYDPCTTDLCNAQTGCVHGALVGVACEDGDVCTASSTCQSGQGCISEDASVALHGRVTVLAHEDIKDDNLSARLRIPAGEVREAVSETGLGLRLFDRSGAAVLDVNILPELFDATESGDGSQYRFHDETGSAGGVTLLVVRTGGRGHADIKLRMRRSGLEPLAEGGRVGLSIWFGEDAAAGTCATFHSLRCLRGNKTVCRG